MATFLLRTTEKKKIIYQIYKGVYTYKLGIYTYTPPASPAIRLRSVTGNRLGNLGFFEFIFY